MTAISAPNATTGRGTIRTLTAREMPLLREHLLRLDSNSRRDRFNGAIDEHFIESYAERCLADGTVVIAYVEGEQVVAAAELHQPDASSDEMPEIAFSVEPHVRRAGLGSILFRRLIAEAEGRGYERLRITTGYSNEAMRALAQKFGARLTFRQGETTGTIDLKPLALPAVAGRSAPRDTLIEPIEATRAIVTMNRAWWQMLLKMYGFGRAA
jgi:hypothetical protein